MGKIAFVFPGQGAQAVGMGRDVFEANAGSRRVYDMADEVLGFKLTELIFNGPEEKLKETANTQPALVSTSLALYEAIREKGVTPDYVAGHSLGEYSALAVAGVLSYEDAVRLVRARGQLMEQAVPGGQGAMAAVLGAERGALAELCASISSSTGAVELANVNCPGQIVVSGTKEGVQAVVEAGKEIGAKRVIPLEVSGPFHSSLMRPAAEKLGKVLEGIDMNPALVPVIANVTAKPISDPDWIRQLLVQQVYSPVLWEDTVSWLVSQEVDTFVEIGPGTVLAGLIKKVNKSVKVISVGSKEAADAFGV